MWTPGVGLVKALVAVVYLTLSSAHKVSLFPSPLIGRLGDIVHARCCHENSPLELFLTNLTLRRRPTNTKDLRPEHSLKVDIKCDYSEDSGCSNCLLPATHENNGSLLVCSILHKVSGEVVSSLRVNRTFHVWSLSSSEVRVHERYDVEKLEEAKRYGKSVRHILGAAVVVICLSWFAVFLVLLWREHLNLHDKFQSDGQSDRCSKSKTETNLKSLRHRTLEKETQHCTNGVSHHANGQSTTVS